MQFRYMKIQHRAGTLESRGAAVIPTASMEVPAMMPSGLLLVLASLFGSGAVVIGKM